MFLSGLLSGGRAASRTRILMLGDRIFSFTGAISLCQTQAIKESFGEAKKVYFWHIESKNFIKDMEGRRPLSGMDYGECPERGFLLRYSLKATAHDWEKGILTVHIYTRIGRIGTPFMNI